MTSETTLVEAFLFPRLIVRTGGRVVEELELRADVDTLSIGRAEDNDVQLADPRASRHHAHLVRDGEIFVLTDLGSANGTRVNGVLITEAHTLEHGERITIGGTELTYQEPGRADQDTVTMAGVPPAIRAAAATQVARGAPPPLEAPAQPARGASRGLVLGFILVAAAVLVALVVIVLFQTGVIGPAEPTPTLAAAGPTSATPAETSAVIPQPTVVTATPTTSTVDPQEMNDLLDQAAALTRRSKFEEATAIYEELTSRAPDDPRPEIGWAWALILDEEASQALLHAQRAVELDPTSSEAAAVLGRVYAGLGETTRAVAWGQNAVELDPRSAEAQAVLAEAYLLNGQTQEAVDAADLALVQDINNADAHRIRAWLYYEVDNDMGRAANELQVAAGLQPELWLRRHELGVLLLEAEDYVTAIMACQDALAIRPKAVTYSAIGEAYYRLGQYDQARASLQQAIATGAEDADTYALLGATYAQLNRCDEAQTYWEQALELEPTQALALEAQNLCQAERPSPTPSPTTVPAVELTPTTAPGATPQATNPPSRPATLGGRIAFPVWNTLTSKYDTYIANVDGSGRRLVAEEMHQPALRPDGSWLVMNGERKDYVLLCMIKPDGSGLREITAFTEDGQAAWSPDGGKLAFASTREGVDHQFRIYIIDDVPYTEWKAEGRALSYGADDIRGQMPAWTADGRIVYRGCAPTSPPDECNGLGLYVVSADPGARNPKQLTTHPEDTAPAVHGDQVAFMSSRDGNWEIYRMNIDGSGLKRLTDNAANDGLPVWSLDGKTITFVSDQGGAWAVWAMSPSGSNRRALFPIGDGGLKFDWQHERISWGR